MESCFLLQKKTGYDYILGFQLFRNWIPFRLTGDTIVYIHSKRKVKKIIQERKSSIYGLVINCKSAAQKKGAGYRSMRWEFLPNTDTLELVIAIL